MRRKKVVDHTPEPEVVVEPATPIASSSAVQEQGSPSVEELLEEARAEAAGLPPGFRLDKELAALEQSVSTEQPPFDETQLEELPERTSISVEFLVAIHRFIKDARARKDSPEDLFNAEQSFVDEGETQYLDFPPEDEKDSESEEEMVSANSSMPARTARGAPLFDPSKPEELIRYFADLEDCFKAAKLEKDDERKEYIGKYAPIGTEEEWKNIEGFDKMTYEELKEAITREYPAAVSMKNGSIDKLNQLCRENQRIGEGDLVELLNFKVSWLLKMPPPNSALLLFTKEFVNVTLAIL